MQTARFTAAVIFRREALPLYHDALRFSLKGERSIAKLRRYFAPFKLLVVVATLGEINAYNVFQTIPNVNEPFQGLNEDIDDSILFNISSGKCSKYFSL